MSNTLERNELIVAYESLKAAASVIFNEKLDIDYTDELVQLVATYGDTTYPRAIMRWTRLNRQIIAEARDFTGRFIANVNVPLKD